MSTYHEPLALIIISSISIGGAAIVALWITSDIILRRGWKSMMAVMIPVYIINALYLWPITIWTYIKVGRPPAVQTKSISKASDTSTVEAEEEIANRRSDSNRPSTAEGDTAMESKDNHSHPQHDHNHSHNHGGHGAQRPMFATVTIGVCHCGAGCVLGDIVGEWLVWATGAAIGSPPRALWVEFLVDFGFAFAFGIVFQYFSIAPMEGNYGPKIIYRALKADTLSLLFFELGLFGWMAIFQIAIFNWKLPMNTVTYWWMMQIGMFLGHWTGVPINWWLIKTGVKIPCA